jgi:hypothetical protein
MAGVLWMMVREGQDRVARWCSGPECTQIARTASGGRGFVVRVGSVVAVVVPPPPDWVQG